MTSHHLPPPNTYSRRLLSAKETAAKFGFKVKWLDEHLPDLEARGFPKPTLGPVFGSPRRWDEAAIDKWLDDQLENANGFSVPRNNKFDQRAIEQTLADRAQGLVL